MIEQKERHASSWQTSWNDVAEFKPKSTLINLETIRALRELPARSVAFLL